MAEVGRYCGNQNDNKGGYNGQHTKVGSYLPNATRGFYSEYRDLIRCMPWRTERM